NMWLGGEREGWERGPYYLDGLVPLAHLLEDERLRGMAHRWLDSILGMQDADGWIGPVQAPGRKPYDQWPVPILLKVLTTHFETFLHTGKTPRDRCTLATHVVNNAMAVKAGGVAWRQSGDPRDRASVYRTLAALDTYHGQAAGVFSGDEHYAGKDPSQGTEL